MPTSHPLQGALDRATTAAYVVIDLLDIASMRLVGEGTRKVRPDTRQASLYRAAVTAAVGGFEEALEGMATGSMMALGAPAVISPVLDGFFGKQLQTPNSKGAKDLLSGLMPDFKPNQHWKATLRCSAPAYRDRKARSGGKHLFTIYNETISLSDKSLSHVLDRFVNVRHSFAHQDSSKGILRPDEIKHRFGPLWQRIARADDEKAFVRELSSVCAATLNNPTTTSGVDPMQSWTIHETHAINSLHLLVGITATTVSGLAEHLAQEYSINPSGFDPLVLRVQEGRWEDEFDRSHFPTPSQVTVEIVKRRPGSRK